MKLLKILLLCLITGYYSWAQISVVDSLPINDDLEFETGPVLYNTVQMLNDYPGLVDYWVSVSSNPSGTKAKAGVHGYDSIYVDQFGPNPWQNYFRFNPDSTWTEIRDIEVDANGNVYLTGTVYDSIIFGPSLKFRYTTEGLLFIKYNSAGQYEWHIYEADAVGFDIEINNNNEVLLTGRQSNGALLFRKYDQSGAVIQSLASTSSTYGFCNGMRAAFDGTDYYITGYFHDTITIDTITLISSSEGMFITRVKGDLSHVYWTDYTYSPGEAVHGVDIEMDVCNYPVAVGTWEYGIDAKMWVYRYHPDGTNIGSVLYNGSGTYKYAEVHDMEIAPGSDKIYFSGLYQEKDPNIGWLRMGYLATYDSCNFHLLTVSAIADKYQTSYSSAPVGLTGFPSGGSFSGPGVSGNEFDPAIAGPGTHKVKYTFSDCLYTAYDSLYIEVKCFPEDNYSEYINIHQNLSQNYPHFKRTESDYFTDSIPDMETGLPVPVQRAIMVSTSQENNGDIYLSLSTDEGEVLWVRTYGGNALDRGTAVKKCDDGFLVAGTTLSFGGSKLKPFIMKLNSDGSMNWFKTYEINNHVLSVNVVELNNGDIAMTGFFNGHEYAGQNHDFFTLVTDASGNILNYRQLGKANRNWEYIRDIEATLDGGFVIAGNTGHNYDYHGGLVMKFDNLYNPLWATELRWVLPGGTYNLGTSGQRSNTFLTSIKETSNGEYIVAGRISDHNGSGAGASFRHGVIAKLTNAGNWLANQMYSRNANDFLILHNLDIMSNGDIALTGKTKDPSASNKERTPLFVVNPIFTPTGVSVEYDYESKNEALNVWESPGGGFTIMGLTGESGANRKPFVLNTDNTGSSANRDVCDMGLNLHSYYDQLEEFPYNYEESSPVVYSNSHSLDSVEKCILIRDCSDTGIPSDRQKTTNGTDMEFDDWLDIEPRADLNTKLDVELYPNPASGVIHFNPAVTEIVVYDLAGKKMMNVSGRNIMELNVERLDKGSYIIQLKEEDIGFISTLSFIIK